MKIGILSTIEQYSWAGTEEVWAQFAQTALNSGHEVCVSAHWRVAQSPQLQTLFKDGLKVVERHPFRPTRLYLLKEHFFSDMRRLCDFQPDILLINSGSLFDVYNLPALKQFCAEVQVPKVFFCHFCAETLLPNDRDQFKEFLQTIDAWVFVSQHNYELAERQLAYRFAAPKVILNAPRFYLSDGALPFPEGDEVNLASVARFETLWKGQDVLLKVLSEQQWNNRAWHLNLYGEGPDLAYIQDLVHLYGLIDKVTCHGYVNDIQAAWKKNHLMVLPSRGEGTPLAVLEAMMCGRPTVTTDVGGNREILVNGKTGFIAEAATPHSFGHALELAWQNQESWKEMGHQAHQKAKSLAATNPAKQLLEFVEEVYS